MPPTTITSKDSTAETTAHIARVQHHLRTITEDLQARSHVHDASKLEEPEKSGFDIVTGKLSELTFGSREYEENRAHLMHILAHHYKENSHHPEHHADGIGGMTLLDIVEMFADWKAATERHKDGSLKDSIELNQARFGYSDELKAIFENTRKALDW